MTNGGRIAQGRPSGLLGALTCTRCGSSIALDRSVLDRARAELIRTLGWETLRGRVELSGCCADCQLDPATAARRDWGRA